MIERIESQQLTDTKSAGPIWAAAGVSFALALVLLVAHSATLLRIEIPAGAVLVGLALYFRRPTAYIHFALWAWFLTPLVRRLVDWQLGFEDQNLVLLTPFLVSAVAGITIRERRRCDPARLLPFYLCLAGIVYGFCVGIIRLAFHLPGSGSLGAIVYGLFDWLSPLLFGLHLYIRWPCFEQNKAAIDKSFYWAVLLLGAYGIYQYIAPPPWDLYWLVSLPQDASNSTVFGIAAPFSVRVWSTMNAPLLFSTVLSAGLILMVELKGWKAVLAAMAGYAAFILSFVRTAWIGWLVGMLILLFSGRSKSARRILLVLALLPCCIAVLSLNSEIRDAIETRIGTLAGVGGDESVQAREDLYRASISKVLEEPFGMGPGSESGRLDSGIFSTIAMLGPTGALLYGAGTLILAFGMFKSPSATPFSTATKAIYLSTLFQALSANLIVNSPGAVMWTAAGLWLASSETVPYAIAKHSAMPLLQTKQLPA